jgi:hypothetical protein
MTGKDEERVEGEAAGGEGAPEDPLRVRTRGPERPVGARTPAEPGNSLGWVHQFRVTPLTLGVILALLAGLWILFETTDLWYRLFP